MNGMIKDGTGKGYLAKVDDHGRLSVAANLISHMQHHALWHKNLYILNYNVTLPDANETPLALFKNLDGTKDFEIYFADVSSNAAVEVKWRFDDEYTSGGTAITPINTNRGSGATLSTSVVEVYEGGTAGDLVLDSTNGVQFHRTWQGANSSHHMNFEGSMIITSSKSASMTVTGAAGDKVNLTAILAYHDAGTEL